MEDLKSMYISIPRDGSEVINKGDEQKCQTSQLIGT